MLRVNRTASEIFELMLSLLLEAAPSSVSELMREFGYYVPVSAEAILCIAKIDGKPFTDELFILFTQVSGKKGNGKMAAFTGQTGPIEGMYTVNQKFSWDDGLDLLTGAMETINGIKNPVKTEDDSFYDYQVNPKPEEKKKYLGLTKPVFFGGVAVLVLLLIFLAIRASQK